MRTLLGALLLLAIGCEPVFPQSFPPAESHKYRVTLTIAGAGGGFTLGVFAGIAAFDDAINADAKVWTTSIVAAAGGAVAGYFIGRALDGSRNRRRVPQTPIPVVPDEFERSLLRARLLDSVGLTTAVYSANRRSAILRSDLTLVQQESRPEK